MKVSKPDGSLGALGDGKKRYNTLMWLTIE